MTIPSVQQQQQQQQQQQAEINRLLQQALEAMRQKLKPPVITWPSVQQQQQQQQQIPGQTTYIPPASRLLNDSGTPGVFDQAQQLAEQMLAAAQRHDSAAVLRLQNELNALLEANRAELMAGVANRLSTFPEVGSYYQDQLDALFQLAARDSSALATVTNAHNRLAADEIMDSMVHDLVRLNGLFDEVTQIHGVKDIEALADVFGIDFTPADTWTDENKEIAVLGAIATEHALRRSATEGQLDKLGLGKVFGAVFGKMEMSYNASDTSYGAITLGPHHIEFHPIAFRAHQRNTEQPGYKDDALFWNVLHEFGHAFNNNAQRDGYAALDRETIYAMVPNAAGVPVRTAIAGLGTNRHFGEVYGIRPYPYQESSEATRGEDFADMFANWVMNSFADNDAGRARFQWMNQHMWGDTSQRGIEGQKAWGFIDIALDANTTSPNWVPVTTQGRRYTVLPGDTVATIAAAFGVDPQKIIDANHIDDPDHLYNFPVLIIPW